MNSYTKDLATLALALFLMLLVAYCAQASGVPPKHRKVVAEIREVVEMVREPSAHCKFPAIPSSESTVGLQRDRCVTPGDTVKVEVVPTPQRRKPSWYELFFPKDDVTADFKGVVP